VSYFLQTVVNGLIAGALYCILALGLTMSVGVARVANLAHTTFMAVGGLAAAAIASQFHVSLPVYVASVLGGAAVTAVLALGCERVLFPRREHDSGAALLVSIGIIVILENAMTRIWGSDGLGIPPVVQGSVTVGGADVSYVGIIDIASAVVVVAAYFTVIRFTGIGSEWRALSQDAHAAELLGIRVRLHRSAIFVIGTSLAGVAGGLLLLTTSVTPLTGDSYLPIAFAAVIVGGLGHPLGSLVGAVFIAMAQSFAGAYGNSQYISIVAMAALVLVLLFRPYGIWGKAVDL
jgi:branched-chain amino acid transport system permease protein